MRLLYKANNDYYYIYLYIYICICVLIEGSSNTVVREEEAAPFLSACPLASERKRVPHTTNKHQFFSIPAWLVVLTKDSFTSITLAPPPTPFPERNLNEKATSRSQIHISLDSFTPYIWVYAFALWGIKRSMEKWMMFHQQETQSD